MKQLITILAMALLLCVPTVVAMAEKKHKPQKFQVAFTIIYNNRTLAEAAAREAQIIKNHPEACKIRSKITEGSSATINFTLSEELFTDN